MSRIGPNSGGVLPSYLARTWNSEVAPQPGGQRAPARANDGSRYQSSFNAEGHQVSTWSGGYGDDTSGLFSPSASQKLGFLANLLSKLPEWEKSGQFKAGVSAWAAEGGFQALNGMASGSGRLSLLEASASGDGSISFKDGALKAQGSLAAQATLIDAEGKIHLGSGAYSLDAAGSAFVGAKAQAHGELTLDPKNGVFAAKLGGEAFAGARAGVEGQANLGEFGSVGGRAEAWAGVGAAFHAEAGFSDGRFKARFDIGAALGIGFKLGFNVDINVRGILDAIKSPFKAIGDLASKAIDGVKDVAGKVVDGVKDVAGKVVDGVKDVANKVVDGVKDAASAVGHFFSSLF